MKRSARIMLLLGALALAFAVLCPAAFSAPQGKPIVIGYVGFVASPGTKPCMDIQRVAVDEINAAGGILGRPVKYIVMDGKGDTSLSVEAARKLIIEDKASFVSVEGRTEICLASQENSAALYREYPHILVFNGPMGTELTDRIVDEAPKYDFCFRDWDPEHAHYAQTNYFFAKTFKDVYKAKRVAFLWEDLAWTTLWRNGIDQMDLPSWEKLAEQNGMEVVYSKAVKPRGTMYMPILQQIAMKKADIIFFISSWFTDTEAFAKQWADSAARDIPVSLYGGVSQTHAFWQMTGGKCLGMISSFTEGEIPLTDKTLHVVELGRKHNIPLQIHVHIAYADIYHFKAAIEKAGGTDDVGKLIKAMEEVETTYSLGRMRYETQKVKPYYHSRMRVDANDPYKTHAGYYYQPIVQFQQDGKVEFIAVSCEENEAELNQYINPKNYKTPAELRKIKK